MTRDEQDNIAELKAFAHKAELHIERLESEEAARSYYSRLKQLADAAFARYSSLKPTHRKIELAKGYKSVVG